MRNLHSNITFNVLAGYPGRNICIRHLREGYIKNEIVKETKTGRRKIRESGRNDLKVRMRGQNKVPDTKVMSGQF